jgi:mono/diheme cytochrome c family protein
MNSQTAVRSPQRAAGFTPAVTAFPTCRVPKNRVDLNRNPPCISPVQPVKPQLLRFFHLAPLLTALLTGCDRLDMYDQPRYKPLAESDLFGDGLSARPPVEGTIARGHLHEDRPFYTGRNEDGKLVKQIPEAAYRGSYERNRQAFNRPYEETSPSELRRILLERGRARFEIYCAVCHGRTGDGRGMIVRRGFRPPPSYHIDRLRNAPVGHFYDVLTNGFGAMASYGSRVEVDDRWAIAAYIRALQLSQNATLDDVPADERDPLASPHDDAGEPGPKREEAAP